MKKILAIGVLLFAPLSASAQQLGNLGNLVEQLGRIIDKLIPIVFSIALLVFFWGLAKYILAAGSEEAKDQGRRIMIGGIIALFVMASIWGIVYFIGQALGIDAEQSIPVPKVRGVR